LAFIEGSLRVERAHGAQLFHNLVIGANTMA
jgi:hypothetical protein